MASKSRVGRSKSQGKQQQRTTAKAVRVPAADVARLSMVPELAPVGTATPYPGEQALTSAARALPATRPASAVKSYETAITRTLVAVLGIGFLIRLLLFPVGNFRIDTVTMTAWADRLLQLPPWDFYSGDMFADHLPGDLWILWFIAGVYDIFGTVTDGSATIPFLWMLKLVPAIADTAIAYLLFLTVRRFSGPVTGLATAALYALNPAAIFIGSVWAQWDAVSVAIAMLAIYLYFTGRYEWALPAIMYATLIKPQTAVIGVIFGVGFILTYITPHYPALRRWLKTNGSPLEPIQTTWRRLGIGLASALGVFLFVLLPFNIGFWPLPTRDTILARIQYALDVYPHTTLNAFTLWGLLSDNWQEDSDPFLLGISYRAWGTVLTAVALVGIVYALVSIWQRLGDRGLIWAATAASFAVYLLPTRGHERYLFPTMVLALLLTGVAPRLIWLYGGLTLTFFANVYWVYSLYENAPTVGPLESGNFIVMGAFANAMLFIGTLALAFPLLSRAEPLHLPRWWPGWLRFPLDGTAQPLPATPRAGVAQPAAPAGVAGPIATPVSEQEKAISARPAWQLWHLPIAIAFVGMAFYFVRIDIPNDYIYDEVYHVFTAAQYVEGNENTFNIWVDEQDDIAAGTVTYYRGEGHDRGPENFAYEWTHPPLGKQLIAIGIWLFGDNPFGWRFSSAVFGGIALFIVYRLGLSLTGRWLVGALAAGLLLIDGLFYVQSRTGMVDIHILVFTTSVLWAFLWYLRLPINAPWKDVFLRLGVLGLLIGCAFATKWNGIYGAAFVILALLVRLGWLWYQSARPSSTVPPLRFADFRNNLIAMPICLVLIPAAVYMASYAQMFWFGYGFADWVEIQRQMFHYHTHLEATHKYMSQFWEWPLALMPVWYGTEPGGENTTGYVFANVNPILAWAMVPAMLYVIYLWWKDRAVTWAPLLVLSIGFLGQWLVWAASPRMSFVYHFLPAVPFGVLAIAIVLEHWLRQPGRVWKVPAIAYIVIALVMFIWLFPIYSAIPVTSEEFNMRELFEGWSIR